MEASTPEGKLNQEWSQKRNGVKFYLAGTVAYLDKILFNESEIILEDERTHLLRIRNSLNNVIFYYKTGNKESKEQFLNAKNKRAKR
jgi:hypothetical protein